MVAVSDSDGGIVRCPLCDWSEEYGPGEMMFTQVHAEIHWENDHSDTEVPESAEFGQYRCPQCGEFHGLLGTVSCKCCGFIPEAVRA